MCVCGVSMSSLAREWVARRHLGNIALMGSRHRVQDNIWDFFEMDTGGNKFANTIVKIGGL